MSKDVSITDLIAEARERQAECAGLSEEEVARAPISMILLNSSVAKLANALELSEREIQRAEDQANNLAGDVVQLEQRLAATQAVTVPTENEYEYEYGFSADGGPVVERAFGIVPFETADAARHTGSKWFEETLDIVRRTKATPAGEWEPTA